MKKTLTYTLIFSLVVLSAVFFLDRRAEGALQGAIANNQVIDDFLKENDQNQLKEKNKNTENKDIIEENNKKETTQNKNTLDGKEMYLVSFNGKNFDVNTYTVSFKDGKIHAKFCNILNGPYGQYDFENNILTSKSMMSTMMYCQEPAGLMEAEQSFTKMLENGAKFQISKNSVTLEKDSDVMIFNLLN